MLAAAQAAPALTLAPAARRRQLPLADWDGRDAVHFRKGCAVHNAFHSQAHAAAVTWRATHERHITSPPDWDGVRAITSGVKTMDKLPDDMQQKILEQLVFDDEGRPNAVGLLFLDHVRAVCRKWSEMSKEAVTPFDGALVDDEGSVTFHDDDEMALVNFAYVQVDEATGKPKGISCGHFVDAETRLPMHMELRIVRDSWSKRTQVVQCSTRPEDFRLLVDRMVAEGWTLPARMNGMRFAPCPAAYGLVEATAVLGCFAAGQKPGLFHYHYDFSQWTQYWAKRPTHGIKHDGDDLLRYVSSYVEGVERGAASATFHQELDTDASFRGFHSLGAVQDESGTKDTQQVFMHRRVTSPPVGIDESCFPRDTNVLGAMPDDSRFAYICEVLLQTSTRRHCNSYDATLSAAMQLSAHAGARAHVATREPGQTRGRYQGTTSWLTFKHVSTSEGMPCYRRSSTNAQVRRYRGRLGILVPTDELLQRVRGDAFMAATDCPYQESSQVADVLRLVADMDCSYPAAAYLFGAGEDHTKMRALLLALPKMAVPRGAFRCDAEHVDRKQHAAYMEWLQVIERMQAPDATMPLRSQWCQLADQLKVMAHSPRPSSSTATALATVEHTELAEAIGETRLELIRLNRADPAARDHAAIAAAVATLDRLNARKFAGKTTVHDEAPAAEAAPAPEAAQRCTRAATGKGKMTARNIRAAAVSDMQCSDDEADSGTGEDESDGEDPKDKTWTGRSTKRRRRAPAARAVAATAAAASSSAAAVAVPWYALPPDQRPVPPANPNRSAESLELLRRFGFRC